MCVLTRLVRCLYDLPRHIDIATQTLDPSKLVEAVYKLARAFAQFYA